MCMNEVNGEQNKGAMMQVDMAGGTKGEEGGNRWAKGIYRVDI